MPGLRCLCQRLRDLPAAEQLDEKCCVCSKRCVTECCAAAAARQLLALCHGARGDQAELSELPYTHTAKVGDLRLPLLNGNVPENTRHLMTAHALFPAVTACLPHRHSHPFPRQGIVIESNPLKSWWADSFVETPTKHALSPGLLYLNALAKAPGPFLCSGTIESILLSQTCCCCSCAFLSP